MDFILLCLSLIFLGLTYLWTLFQGCLRQGMARIPSLWRCIGSLRWHSSYQARNLMMLAMLLTCYLKKWCISMDYQEALFLIVTQNSQVTFGEPCGVNQAQSFFSPLRVIPQTKGQTEVVNRTLSFLLREFIKKNIRLWENVYLMQNLLIIGLLIALLDTLNLKLCMDSTPYSS